ncbi:MAG: hypothetical protein JW726_08185 [Anaerolineales bacterium]|nr:hypothetical protein [Anaerolineales bacterium]
MIIRIVQRKQHQVRHAIHRFAARRWKPWSERPKVLLNSVPKSGTNLLSRCLELMPGLTFLQVSLNRPKGPLDLRNKLLRAYPGSFIKGHILYTNEYQEIIQNLNFTTLLMVRDPRDIAVSLMHWVTYKNPHHRLHHYFSSLKDDNERLMAVIRGVLPHAIGDQRGLENIAEYVGAFLPWTAAGSCVVRFEYLVGPDGGGSQEKQFREVQKIAHHINITLGDAQIEAIAKQLYSSHSHTFRRGQIGDWSSHFMPQHQAAFQELANPLLSSLGYAEYQEW